MMYPAPCARVQADTGSKHQTYVGNIIIRRWTDGALIYLSQTVKCRNRSIENISWPLSFQYIHWSRLDSPPLVSGRCCWTTRIRSEPWCRSQKWLWEKLQASRRAAQERCQGGPAPRPRAQAMDPPCPRILQAHTRASGQAGASWPRPRPPHILGPTPPWPDHIILLQPTVPVLHNLQLLQPATVRCLQPAPEPVFRPPCPRHRPRLQDPGPKSTQRSWKDHSGSFQKAIIPAMTNTFYQR